MTKKTTMGQICAVNMTPDKIFKNYECNLRIKKITGWTKEQMGRLRKDANQSLGS